MPRAAWPDLMHPERTPHLTPLPRNPLTHTIWLISQIAGTVKLTGSHYNQRKLWTGHIRSFKNFKVFNSQMRTFIIQCVGYFSSYYLFLAVSNHVPSVQSSLVPSRSKRTSKRVGIRREVVTQQRSSTPESIASESESNFSFCLLFAIFLTSNLTFKYGGRRKRSIQVCCNCSIGLLHGFIYGYVVSLPLNVLSHKCLSCKLEWLPFYVCCASRHLSHMCLFFSLMSGDNECAPRWPFVMRYMFFFIVDPYTQWYQVMQNYYKQFYPTYNYDQKQPRQQQHYNSLPRSAVPVMQQQPCQQVPTRGSNAAALPPGMTGWPMPYPAMSGKPGTSQQQQQSMMDYAQFYYQYYMNTMVATQGWPGMPTGRTTPKIFIEPHIRVTLSSPGIMIQVRLLFCFLFCRLCVSTAISV